MLYYQIKVTEKVGKLRPPGGVVVREAPKKVLLRPHLTINEVVHWQAKINYWVSDCRTTCQIVKDKDQVAK